MDFIYVTDRKLKVSVSDGDTLVFEAERKSYEATKEGNSFGVLNTVMRLVRFDRYFYFCAVWKKELMNDRREN